MIKSIIVPALSVALEKLKEIIASNEEKGKNTVIFCEDRLTLAAERTVCAAVGGTFDVSVYTLARFLSSEMGKRSNVLSSQGSAMAIRRIIEDNKDSLKLFGKFSAAASAGAVYDTIALLYSSKISADELKNANADGLLESKLSDISLIYSLYDNYLKENGKIDRNAYLGELPSVISSSEKIAGSEVIFLGFQSFTRSSSECVRAAFQTAKNVYGLFIGGAEEIYVNEGAAIFEGIAEEFGGAEFERAPSTLNAEAEALRVSLFNPETYFSFTPVQTDKIHIFEAADEDEEIEFIAASIKKHVLDGGVRYGKISVMLPDVAATERTIERIFSEYRIPYYADRRHALSEHPVCEFILNYLVCAYSGCTLKDTDAVVSSPLFPESRDDKDAYRNYALRLADFRGGIKREPKQEILDYMKFNYAAVQRVRETFLRGLKFIPAKGTPSEITAGIKALLEDFKVEEKLQSLKEKFRDSYPTASEFSGRVYDAALSVIEEAENILGGAYLPLNEYIKILKSGFTAAEISLIPPKADAVFVGDIAATANTGSDILFAASLTEGVPKNSSDTSLLTDGEIAVLERVNLDISPKIRQVNMRRREQTALNICAFRDELYLSFPAHQGGEESNASEIIAYASAVFSAKHGAVIPLNIKRDKPYLAPYYCSEKLPALKRLNSPLAGTVYKILCDHGFKEEADAALRQPKRDSVSYGRELFVTYDSVSPTALETYYACPYRNFMQQGLKLQEREEGAMRPLDTGNFIHTVLQKLAPDIGTCVNADEARARAGEAAKKLLLSGAYSSLTDTKSGQYTADELIKEAGEVTAGMYEQLANSQFKVENTEWRCEINLDGGVRINGRIDRVDGCGDMVRIIDYKTGTVDSSVTKYYMGLKLQLPLYLTAAAVGRRAVGAYYFPASVEYKPKADGVFRLQGFMDGSDDVVSASDTTLKPKEKSAYFDAYLTGKKIDSAMDNETFADFLQYSALIARKGTREMLEGNISPSPAEDACKYCKMGGSCNFAAGIDGEERSSRTVKCGDIARIVRKNRGDE
ncbi:MAG: PD-(D/E)XK nuclease family protein [Clostridia bacterium]|nr:PD-(D/E)XK nuclease family protein [Clostridia bacterium]